MADPENYEKDFGPVDSAREHSGIYGLGFDPASMMGFLIPSLIVGAIGVIGAIYIYKFL